jgi:hypothetical protein
VTPTTVSAMASRFDQDSTSWARRTESRTVTTIQALDAPTATETGTRVNRLPYAMDIIKRAPRHAAHGTLDDEEKAVVYGHFRASSEKNSRRDHRVAGQAVTAA